MKERASIFVWVYVWLKPPIKQRPHSVRVVKRNLSPAEILKFSGRKRIYGRARNRKKFRAPFYASFARLQRLPERRLFAQEVFHIRLRVAAD